MSIGTVTTRGFGSGGSIAHVSRRGFGSAEPPPVPLWRGIYIPPQDRTISIPARDNVIYIPG